MSSLRSILALVSISFLVAACGSDRPVYFGHQGSTEGMPGYVNGNKTNPNVKLGKPYRVSGRTYVPTYDPDYDEVGLASWYGPGFHGGRTANGEQFDKYAFTAAHTTLPLPSIVRVTNVKNGRQVYVRVNDRGPFADGRIIDLSKAAAEQIDLVRAGVAKVRVEYMPNESQRLVDMMNRGRNPKDIDIAHEIVGKSAPAQLASNATPQGRWWEYVNPVKSAHAEESMDDLLQSESVQSNDLAPPSAKAIPPAAPLPDPLPPEVPPSVRAMTITPETATVSVEPPLPPVTPSMPGYYVQIGSFSVRANAEKMSANYGEPTLIEPITGPNGAILYRLRMGPFPSEADAQSALATVRDGGVRDARIIKP